ncbi:hypothetical protein HQQ94_11375 [Shewanella sp. VB17]|uniref:hypothetical protein n=1 Tax=Shewanella sp. VB17 TaxID=2739432 RepID=UPI00156570CF|nr:hypothetical protein [Shewanella sp. VB17]NRD73827.1 hypothetical protein [Shewanella sp. VB17]
MKFKHLTLTLSLIFTPIIANAGSYWSDDLKIDSISSFTAPNDNNIYIRTNNLNQYKCHKPDVYGYGDFKLVRDDSGDYKSSLSILLAALTANLDVRLFYTQDVSGNYCTINLVQVKRNGAI